VLAGVVYAESMEGKIQCPCMSLRIASGCHISWCALLASLTVSLHMYYCHSGFCGMRTVAFEEPLQVSDAEGFYIDCRLTSDDEPGRRVWKMTTRSERSRGEELYQAQFTLPSNSTDEWTRVKIPFTDFKLVRGPRMVEGGTPLNATAGIYQIGLSMSKFLISQNTTEIDNFRPGYFELQLKAIGLYSNTSKSLQLTEPSTLSPAESKRRRPLVVKMLLPVLGLLFSEER